MLPDSDANAGMIRFSHTLRVGFSLMAANNDQVNAELQIDAAFWRIMNRLRPDQHIMNVLLNSLPDNTRIESITRGSRRHVFGASGLNNETPIAELQYDVSTFYRTGWPPIITDDLITVDVITGVKSGDSQAEMDQRQQVHVQYMFQALRKAMIREPRRLVSKVALRGLRQRVQKLAKAAPTGVRVIPAKEEYRTVLKHPHGGGFPATGSAEWPDDRFTKRRLADGPVTRESDARKAKRDEGPRPKHHDKESNSAA